MKPTRHVWKGVKSSTSNKEYTVIEYQDGTWSCGCPRWTKNKLRPDCAHILGKKLELIQALVINAPAVAVDKKIMDDTFERKFKF